MKFSLLFCCLGLCCFAACKKDNNSPNYWGETSVLKDGTPWSGEIIAYQNRLSTEKVDIDIQELGQDHIQLDGLYFFKVPKKVGKYYLSKTDNQLPDDDLVGAEYFINLDDQLEAVYEVKTIDSSSYVEITKFNPAKKELWGVFNLTLYKGSLSAPVHPDSLVFTNGSFHTRIDN